MTGNGKELRLSLCMIAKDEANRIGSCFENVRSLVDEWILVDTGSTDGTQGIARSLGGRVFQAPWEDDFSKARNLSLGHAAGDWILVLDADEMIDRKDHRRIRNLLAGEADAYRLIQRNYQLGSTSVDWVAVTGASPLAMGAPGYVPSPLVRLFRNLEGVRFTGRIHELVEHSLFALGKTIIDTDIPIHHYGHFQGEVRIQAKRELYSRIGAKKVVDHPEDPRGWCELGVLYMEMGRARMAEGPLRRACSLDCCDPKPLFNLGVSLYRQGRLIEAAEAYREVLKLDPTHMGAYNNLAQVLLSEGGWQEAAEIYETALQQYPRHHVLFYNYGLALEKGGRIEEAAAQYRSALSIDPDFPDPKNRLAGLIAIAHDAPPLSSSEKEKEANADRTGRDLPGRTPLSDRGGAEIRKDATIMTTSGTEEKIQEGEELFRRGDLLSALRVFDAVLNDEPANLVALNNRGVVLHSLGRYPEAGLTFSQILRQDGGNQDAICNLIRSLQSMGMPEKAREILDAFGGHIQEEDRRILETGLLSARASEPCGTGPERPFTGEVRTQGEIHPLLGGRRLFLIVGCPKSGTTWIQNVVNGHPDIVCAGESNVNLLRRLFGQMKESYNENILRINKTYIGQESGFALLDERDLDHLFTSTLGLLFAHTAATSEATCIGMKNPDQLGHMDFTASLFPGMKYLHIIRDGRDVAVSGWFHNLRNEEINFKKRFPSFQAYAEGCARSWRMNIEKAREFGRRYPDRYFEFRYEDLQREPEATLEGILLFLGVDASPSMVEACLEAGSFQRLSKGRNRGEEDRCSFFRKGVVGDWKNHFDEPSVRGFAGEAGLLLKELGYEGVGS